MEEVLRTTDLVRMSFATAVLKDAGIPHAVFDTHMSILEGSIGILPRRLMVDSDDLAAARRVIALSEADLGQINDHDQG